MLADGASFAELSFAELVALVPPAAVSATISIGVSNMIRGSTVFFSAPCLDQSGNVVIPDTANIYLVYTDVYERRILLGPLAMTVDGNIVSYDWDSSVADAKPVRVSIRGTAGMTHFASDYTLDLSANEANPAI